MHLLEDLDIAEALHMIDEPGGSCKKHSLPRPLHDVKMARLATPSFFDNVCEHLSQTPAFCVKELGVSSEKCSHGKKNMNCECTNAPGLLTPLVLTSLD